MHSGCPLHWTHGGCHSGNRSHMRGRSHFPRWNSQPPDGLLLQVPWGRAHSPKSQQPPRQSSSALASEQVFSQLSQWFGSLSRFRGLTVAFGKSGRASSPPPRFFSPPTLARSIDERPDPWPLVQQRSFRGAHIDSRIWSDPSVKLGVRFFPDLGSPSSAENGG